MNDTDKQRQVYQSLIDPNGIVFDIGANIGNRTAMFRNLCKKVIAVEPQNKLANLMKERFKGSNVIVVNSAAGSSPGRGFIYFPSDDTLGRHGVGTMSGTFMTTMGPKIFNLDKGWDLNQETEITTLDTLIIQFGKPSFIKIDVEGYEFQVVNGLSQKIPALSFEFHPQLDLEYKMVISRLGELGFHQFNYCLAETFEWQLEWCSGKELIADLEKFRGCREMYGDVYAR